MIFSEIYENPLQIYDVEKFLILNDYKLTTVKDVIDFYSDRAGKTIRRPSHLSQREQSEKLFLDQDSRISDGKFLLATEVCLIVCPASFVFWALPCRSPSFTKRSNLTNITYSDFLFLKEKFTLGFTL